MAIFSSITFESKVITTRRNNYMTAFINRGNVIYSVQVKKSKFAFSFRPVNPHRWHSTQNITDSALKLYYMDWGKICKKHSIAQIITKPHS